jgi:hypothetical protein
MKKLYFLIIILFSLQTFSQKDYSRYYNSWRLGLNLGGAWQTADYRSCWGMAGGITLEKGFHENSTNIFSFAIRGRYLGANTYGMDFNRNYDIKTNDAYNGKYDPAVNFVDTISVARQYVYDNYKMKLGEGSLELQLSFNRLRERTRVLLNLWGGVGITSFRTKSDLLDGNGMMYDFSVVDSTGSRTKALNTYNGLIDKKYESYAYGSKNGNLITFSPSAGIGLGYQFSPGFSMLWEYKVTFPQGLNADLLDGKIGTNNDAIAGSNDYYHYTGLNLVFTLRGKKKAVSSNQTTYTNTVAPTNTVSAVTTNTTPITNTVVATTPTVVNTNTVVPTPTVSLPKPVITFITPPVSGHIVNNQQYKISAQILNVTNANQIQFKFNGVSYFNFTFNAQSHILEYNSTLNTGNNNVQIIATNAAGSDNKSTTVVYELPKPTGTPPVVTYINPVQPGTIVSSPSYIVNAQVLNVGNQSGISIYVNGMTSPFVFNNATKQVTFTVNLNPGKNTISITGNNPVGEDTKVTDITYQEPQIVKNPPVVTITNPGTTPVNSAVANYVFKANVTNITTKTQLVVKLNGNIINNYSFNNPGILFPATLVSGNNVFEVTATNNDGSDTKSVIVNYRPKIVAQPPVVSLINPAFEINASDDAFYNFKLSVLHVSGKANIELLFNGTPQTNFTYDAVLKEVFFQTNLVVGDNTVSVKGTNLDGVDSKTIHVNYTPHADLKLPPVITFINPSASPFNSQNLNYVFNATIGNMPNTNGLVVKYNNVVISNYTYDGFNLSYTSVLNAGSNTLEISATNTDGNDLQSATVNFRPKAVAKPPVVSIIQPVGTPTVSTRIYNFQFKALNVLQNQIEVNVNGQSVTQFNFSNFTGSFNDTLKRGSNTIVVKATNQDGTASKSETVFLLEDLTTPTNPVNPIDTSSNSTTIPTSGEKTTVICHGVTDSLATPQTMTVPLTALFSHLGHGDTQGACPVKKANGIKVTPRINTGTQPNETKATEPKQDTLKKQPFNTPRSPR